MKKQSKETKLAKIILSAILLIFIIAVVISAYNDSNNNSTDAAPIKKNKQSFNVEETHYKFIRSANIRYRTFTVESIDTAKIMKFVNSNTGDFLTVDYFLFNTPSNLPIWLDKFNTTDEVSLAIYQSCPELIILASQGEPYPIPCDWFKVY